MNIEQWQIYSLADDEFILCGDNEDSWKIESPFTGDTKFINKEVLLDAVKLGDAKHITNPPLSLGQKVIWLGRKYRSCSDDNKFLVGREYVIAGFNHDNNDDVDIEQFIGGVHTIIRTTPSEISIEGLQGNNYGC